MDDEMKITSGCMCGAVRYEAVGEPMTVAYCHCASCRRHTGAPVVAFVDIDPAKVGSTLREKPIISTEELPGLIGDGTVVLAAVSSRGARALIRDRLGKMGLREASDFWCVA